MDLTKKIFNVLKSARSVADENQDDNLSLQILTAGRKMFLRMQLQNFLKILANYMR